MEKLKVKSILFIVSLFFLTNVQAQEQTLPQEQEEFAQKKSIFKRGVEYIRANPKKTALITLISIATTIVLGYGGYKGKKYWTERQARKIKKQEEEAKKEKQLKEEQELAEAKRLEETRKKEDQARIEAEQKETEQKETEQKENNRKLTLQLLATASPDILKQIKAEALDRPGYAWAYKTGDKLETPINTAEDWLKYVNEFEKEKARKQTLYLLKTAPQEMLEQIKTTAMDHPDESWNYKVGEDLKTPINTAADWLKYVAEFEQLTEEQKQALSSQ